MIWVTLAPHVDLGFLPGLISEDDPRPVREQLADTYRHGGGWDPMAGFTVRDGYVFKYPGDPPMTPIASTKLRDELIVLYDYSFLGVFQPDGSFEVSRVDYRLRQEMRTENRKFVGQVVVALIAVIGVGIAIGRFWFFHS